MPVTTIRSSTEDDMPGRSGDALGSECGVAGDEKRPVEPPQPREIVRSSADYSTRDVRTSGSPPTPGRNTGTGRREEAESALAANPAKD